MIVELSVNDNHFEFATNISTALKSAETEYQELNERDKKLFWKTLRRNKKMLKSMDVSKKEFDMSIFDAVYEALNYKYMGSES